MTEIYLHIGMQRTGSTFLQKEIFPKMNCNNIRQKNMDFIMDLIQIEEMNSEQFSEIKEKIQSYLHENGKNLISDENIWWHQYFKKDARYIKLQKLKQLFPEAKIIFGTRDREDLLLSWYIKYVTTGGILSFTDYQRKFVNLIDLDFEEYLEHLYTFYPKKNVFVYQFEKLKNNPEELIKNLSNFMSVTPPAFKNRRYNRGYSLWQLKVSCFFNRLWKTKANPGGLISIPYNYIPYRVLFQSPLFPEIIAGRKATISDLGGLLKES